MIDYLKYYDDMGAYYVDIGEDFISEVLDVLCKHMNFVLEMEGEGFTLYKSTVDDRAFLMATKCVMPLLYGVSIKCKSTEKSLFFRLIEPQLLETHRLWGIPDWKPDEYPNRLTYKSNNPNPVEYDLRRNGLI